MTSWPLSYQYKERERNNINIELKLSKKRVWRDKINHSGQTDGTLSALIKQSWHIYTNNRVVHINDKSHTCIYKYIFFLSLGKTSKFTWEKEKERENLQMHTNTLHLFFSNKTPPQPPRLPSKEAIRNRRHSPQLSLQWWSPIRENWRSYVGIWWGLEPPQSTNPIFYSL